MRCGDKERKGGVEGRVDLEGNEERKKEDVCSKSVRLSGREMENKRKSVAIGVMGGKQDGREGGKGGRKWTLGEDNEYLEGENE